MNIKRIDHLVLTVRDIAATCDFYARVLGMQVVTFDDGLQALHFGKQKINLHEAGKELEPKASTPIPGSADLCLLTELPLTQVIEHMQACGVTIEVGPIRQAGARRSLVSIYIRDPDGNLVEIANELDDTGKLRQPQP
ncbi:MAG: VOC family protein [Chloroflexota bacterium]|nr:VOC family protein [Chloroflexota bacterium]